LLNNAIEACEKGGTVKVKTKVHEADAMFEVKDDGCGITPENKEKYFPIFTLVKKGAPA